jgi:4-hydroxybenzoate polyprenyltransferase
MNRSFKNPTFTAKRLARLSRPQNILYPGLLASITCYILTSSLPNAIACYVYIFTLYSFAVTYNNSIDKETDLLNRRIDNPFINHELPMHIVRNFLICILFTFLVVQLFLNQPISILLGLLFIFLGYIYSNSRVSIQSRGWWSPLLLAVCYGSIPAVLGLSQKDALFSVAIIQIILLQIVILLPVLLAKDYKDLVGDRKTGKKTPLVLYGEKKVKTLAHYCALTVVVAVFTWIVVPYKIWILSIPLLFYSYFVYELHNHYGKVDWRIQKLGVLSILITSVLTISLIQ